MSCLVSTDQESAMKNLIAALTLVIVSPCVWAASQTVTLSVPGMTCAACPFTVKKALTQVPGVQAVEVRYQAREAVVSFADSQTQVDALTQRPEEHTSELQSLMRRSYAVLC